MPHRDDRNAARSRSEALERQLAEAEAEREEAEAELARSEAEREALERRLRGEPIPDEEWSREEFAKRVTTEAPKLQLDYWPERPAPIARSSPPAPIARSSPAPPPRGASRVASWAQRPADSTRGTRTQLSASLMVSALLVHLPALVWVSRLRYVVTPEQMDLLVAGQIGGGLLQCVLHFLVMWWLRASHPFRGLAASALMSAFSALIVGMIASGGPFVVTAGLTALCVSLHGWLVSAVANGDRV